MGIVLCQTFPLGRFHATPWRASPHDDPHGEWPPSPWRLVRAVTARWHQWNREIGEQADKRALYELIRAMCTSTWAFSLPANARRGVALRFYQPTKWGWWPAAAKSPGMRDYRRVLVRDNYWAIPPDADLLWFLDGGDWSPDVCQVLDRCLERVAYLGRSESYTEIARVARPGNAKPNVVLYESRCSSEDVPVLVPDPLATPEDVQRSTGDKLARTRTLPPGARSMYATRLRRPPARERSRPIHEPEVRLVQFAVGSAVAPDARLVCHLTGRFRARLLALAAEERAAALGFTKPAKSWQRLPAQVREELQLLAGKDLAGHPLNGHGHLRLAVWFWEGKPARLLAWRDGPPFARWELDALYRCSERELSWQHPGQGGAPAWAVRLLPMDTAVAPPPGFEGRRARTWLSMTPYVPPRHRLREGGRQRPRESVQSQTTRELRQLGVLTEENQVVVDFEGGTEQAARRWTAVHLPANTRLSRRFTGDKLGFMLRLVFAKPVPGPLAIGHSSHYGLGLFEPGE